MKLFARFVWCSSSAQFPLSTFIDQHSRIQASTLSCQTTLLWLWSFPWHSRARIYPGQHPTFTWQGLYQSFLGWGDRESERGIGEISEHRCRPSITPSTCHYQTWLHLRSRNLYVYFRLEARCSVLSYKTPPGTGHNGSEWALWRRIWYFYLYYSSFWRRVEWTRWNFLVQLHCTWSIIRYGMLLYLLFTWLFFFLHFSFHSTSIKFFSFFFFSSGYVLVFSCLYIQPITTTFRHISPILD